MLGPAFLNTLELTILSVVAVIAVSIGLGIVCALTEGKWLDKSVRGAAFFLTSMPSYLLAALLVWYFSVKLDWLPTNGKETFQSYILPVSVITISYAGLYFRIVRSEMLTNLNEDYVLFGRACGLPEGRITKRLLRNSLTGSRLGILYGYPNHSRAQSLSRIYLLGLDSACLASNRF